MRRAPLLIDLGSLLLGVVIALALFGGCGDGDEPDAYGNFEATEVTVSADAQGHLLRFDVDEGDRLAEGAVVGLIDTTQLGLQRQALGAQRQSLLAQRQATLAQGPEIAAQAGALRAQLETANEELARTQRLFADQAATARELNQREGEVAVLRRQIEQAAARGRTVREQAASVAAQAGQIEAQIGEIDERMRDAHVVSPTAGTVLTVLVERGETVRPGTPLYTVADLDTLKLRAYASGTQLPRLRLGASLQVVVDGEEGDLQTLDGTVTWIAAEAQFTPTPIQTRDERAELVYAFDVRVPNPDGLLKVGMPGEVRFADAGVEEPR
jgi:HlyD family secretion protein